MNRDNDGRTRTVLLSVPPREILESHCRMDGAMRRILGGLQTKEADEACCTQFTDLCSECHRLADELLHHPAGIDPRCLPVLHGNRDLKKCDAPAFPPSTRRRQR